MKRYGSNASVGMAVLLVRASLADLCEPESLEQERDLAWFENRYVAHVTRP